MAEQFTEPDPVQYTGLSLTGPPGGFVRGEYFLTNDPDYSGATTTCWSVQSSENQSSSESKTDKRQGTSSKRGRSTSTSSTSSTSPSTSPSKKCLKTSSTSKPATSSTGFQPSTSYAHKEFNFDPSSIDANFQRYCAVVNNTFYGRKYWQMKLTVKSFNATAVKEGEVRTLCEVGFAPMKSFTTHSNSLAHPNSDTFIVKIGKSENRWRALWAHKTNTRTWADVYEANMNQQTKEYSFKFGLFLDSPHKKISFYAADDDKKPKIIFNANIEYKKGYPIFSLGESELSNVATVRLEMDNAKPLRIISEVAAERDRKRQEKRDSAKKVEQKSQRTEDSELGMYSDSDSS